MMKILWSSLLVVTFVVAATACTDGETTPVDGKCREFQVCKNGTWTKDSCNTPMRKYSKEQKKCMWWFQVDCTEATQCSEENQLLKNPYTCSSYYKCSRGKLEVHNCVWPFYFDGNGCKLWGDCKGADEKYAEGCSGDEAEPIADSTRQYKTCKDGFFEQTSCFWWKKFDVETKSCQWFWKVKTDVTTCDGNPRAPENSDGKSYYQCNKETGILMKKSCLPLQKFDSEQGRCMFTMKAINLDEVNSSLRSEEAAKAFENINNILFTSAAGKKVAQGNNKNSSVSIKRVLRSIRNSYLMDTSCVDGSFKSDINCLKYKECILNTWQTRTCPNGQIFSYGGCKWAWKAQCDPGSCITGQKTAYALDCKKYYFCDENNNEVLTDCPQSVFKPTQFNPSSGECDFVLWWKGCPSTSSYLSCSEDENCGNYACGKDSQTACQPSSWQTTGGSGPNEFQICTGGKWVTVKCSGSEVYKADLNGCGCSKEAEHRAALNSKQYLECQSGRWIQLDCLIGGVFNPMTKICEKPRARRSVQIAKNPNDCISGDTKTDVMNGVCSTYLFCTENGKWARRACPVGEYFNGLNACGKELCPYIPVPGDCESFVTANGTKEKCDFGFRFDSTTKQCVPFAEASCLEVQCEGTERKNHPTSCNRYLQCHDQQWEVEDCGWFRNKFDMRIKKCVFAWWGNKKTCRYDPAKCEESSNSLVAGNCRKYLTCKDGREQERSCFWPKKFDSSSSECVWWGAKCA